VTLIHPRLFAGEIGSGAIWTKILMVEETRRMRMRSMHGGSRGSVADWELSGEGNARRPDAGDMVEHRSILSSIRNHVRENMRTRKALYEDWGRGSGATACCGRRG
jgi:hypothetical protein